MLFWPVFLIHSSPSVKWGNVLRVEVENLVVPVCRVRGTQEVQPLCQSPERSYVSIGLPPVCSAFSLIFL